MLERASACLDSGVRLSLRAQRRAPKSRRLLHSTFWHHAAGDLDLPPCLLSAVCPAASATTSASATSTASITTSTPATTTASAPAHPSHSARSTAHSTHSTPHPSQEHQFLDFLYPAQTLAFMSRVSSTHLDRIWEKRAAHRASSPAKGLRAYSSLSSTPTPSPPSANPAPSAPPTTLHQPVLNSPRKELSHLLLTHPNGPDADVLVKRAWDLYATMNEKDQRKPPLLTDLITWLSKLGTAPTHAHIIRLFAALPPQSRTASIYDAVVGACVGSGQIQAALDIHQQALQQEPGSLVGADHLMLHAVSHEDWDMARSLYRRLPTHTDRFDTSPMMNFETPENQPDFPHVPPEVLDLACAKLVHAPNLPENLHSLARNYHSTQDDNVKHELLHLFKFTWRALLSSTTREPAFYTPGHHGNTARAKFRKLVLRLHKAALPSPELYEYCLLRLVAACNHAVIEDFSATVAFVYNLYRKSAVFTPSNELLQSLIALWRDQRLTLGGRGPSSNFISLQLYIDDMDTFHNGLDTQATYTIMDCLARLGYVQGVKDYAQKLKSLHPDGLDGSSMLWPLVYVHAKQAAPSDAAKQLHALKAEYGVDPDLRCWNIVIHAYEEANQLEGALATLNQLLETGIAPDPFTFAPLLALYAKQGDVEGANDILHLAKSHGVPPTVFMLNSMIVAYVNNGDMDRAEQILEEAVKLARGKKARTSLTTCFNTILTGHALRRNIDATMTVYRRMKEDGVPLDANTYGALVQVLCLFRQTDVAHKLVSTVMQLDHIRPLAFHYAILMVGYINQALYDKALKLETEMIEARVRPSNSTRTALLKARALLEHVTKGGDRKYDDGSAPLPLEDTMDEFMKLLDARTEAPVISQPAPGYRGQTSDAPLDVSFLVFIHGKRRAFEVAHRIFETYTSKLSEGRQVSVDAPPIRLVTALMSVHFRAQEYSEVDRYWKLVLSQAEAFRTLRTEQKAGRLTSSESAAASPSEVASATIPQIPHVSRFMLSRPLRYYMASQFSQRHVRPSGTMTVLVSSLLSKGYRFDNRTWNGFVVHLCRCSPPRALLAFALTEKFLIDNWPGWVSAKSGVINNKFVRPKRSALAEGVEYLRNPGNKTRYRSHETLVPQYKTMVYLANAFLELRNMQATGTSASNGMGRSGSPDENERREVDRQVGSLKDVRERAPRTLEAVQSMPRVNDRLQQKIIRRS